MKILFGHKRVNEATDVYKEMIEKGLTPNCYTYTILMDYLASSGKVKEALEIFNRMQEADVQPDKATCNILIEIFCKTGEIWAIFEILRYMKENFFVLRYSVYQKALETLKLAGESDILLREVNRQFSEEHFSEDTDRYDAISPDSDFNMENRLVLYLMNKQNLVAVDSLLADMMDKCVPLETMVVSRIIEKVVEIVEKMVKQGLSLGTHLNSLLIYRLGCNREAASAAKVFDLLPDNEKSTAAYTALIDAYFSSGNTDRGLETFKTMKGRKEKKRLQTERCFQNVPMEEMICNLLFAGEFTANNAR
ncbi:UNVERIFIED_CONTAM: Pentatricopeptide repeat-containing protein [Sesamum latifolium]|uniref:Pentatricopeptide repeat-containing protein n=1 Tax=Sesamum latifolium TaxID=2727402 RepID=A0AAW2XAM3_9LAMI